MLKKKKRSLNIRAQEAELIRKKLKFVTFEPVTKDWLDTGSPRFNSVIGSREKGAPYGKILIFYGKRSSGKTLAAAELVAMGQEQGAVAGWADAENSYDENWFEIQGVNTAELMLFKPKLIKKKSKHYKADEIRLQSSEELFSEMQTWCEIRRQADPKGKIILVVDSTTALMPAEEEKAGADGQNMRTKSSPAQMWSQLLKRWQALAYNYNVLLILIGQMRVNPNAMFGNPEYLPGGEALQFYPAIIVKVKRAKRGQIISNGKIVGLVGTMANEKNKAGGGSIEYKSCGFTANFMKRSWRFMSKEKALKLAAKMKGAPQGGE